VRLRRSLAAGVGQASREETAGAQAVR